MVQPRGLCRMIGLFCKRSFLLLLLCLLVVGAAGCKTPEQITQDQKAVKTTQEIVVKQELEREERILKVMGVGKVDILPDSVTVKLSVSAQGLTAEEAQQKISELLPVVLEAMQLNGLSEQQMEIGDGAVYPIYENEKDQAEITGYRAINIITLQIQNVKTVNDIVSSAMQAGASELLYVELHLSNEEAAYRDALAAAVQNAQTKADVMAQASKIDLDGPKLVQESVDILKTDYHLIRQPIDENGNPSPIETPLQAEKITVTAEVEVEFLILYPVSQEK